MILADLSISQRDLALFELYLPKHGPENHFL